MKKILFSLSLFISAASFEQQLYCDNKGVQEAFTLAVQTVDINTRRGILAAGADYGGEWTRDISINSWNGVSLLRPQVAENSLWSVTINKDTVGHQYWDKIIWVIAALNHYKVTGDKDFLAKAYTCSANTMKALEGRTFDEKYGLFTGPSVFNDGIAAYPEPVYEAGNYSGGVLDHKNSVYIKCLSTNAVYYGAYLALLQMADILKQDKEALNEYRQKAGHLRNNIIKHFYNPDKNTFSYLIDQNGTVNNSQEGLGISFVTIFGIINGDKAGRLISNAAVSKYGITSVYPDFPRYSAEKPGRHNNIIWPMVNGFYANAALVCGSDQSFSNELFNETHLALDEDKGNYNFREIYNPYSGKPDGGYQAWGAERPNYHWESCRLQTWSATAYISMVLNGLFGMKFNSDSLAFSPFLPQGIHTIELKKLTWQNVILDININGKGKQIKSFSVDGKVQTDHSVAAAMKGKHIISVEVE